MAELNQSGQVQSLEQIRQQRIKLGYCDNCKNDPVHCYQIKKRLGGLTRERVPLTSPGKVFNGTCLRCHPDKDPDVRRKHRDRPSSDHRGSRQLGGNIHRDQHNNDSRSHSTPMPSSSRMPTKQSGCRDLAKSCDPGEREQDLMDELQELDKECENNEDKVDEPDEYVETVEHNIFGEPVVVTKKRTSSRRTLRAPRRATDNSLYLGRKQDDLFGRNSSLPPEHGHQHEDFVDDIYEDEHVRPGDLNYPEPEQANYREHSPPRLNRELDQYGNGGGSPPRHSPPRLNRGLDQYGNGGGSPPRHSPSRSNTSAYQSSRSGYNSAYRSGGFEEHHLAPIPQSEPLPDDNLNSYNEEASAEAEPMDALALLIAQHCAQNPQQSIMFNPDNKAFVANAELHLDDDMTIMSNITDPTYAGRGSVMTMETYQNMKSSYRTGLTAIDETASGGSGSQQRSLTSHAIREPEMFPDAEKSTSPPTHDTHGMEHYFESSTPHLMTLREIVGQCTAIGCDPEAIDTVTQALIHDNATSMSEDLALYCLTTLWVLARKSDENKRKIIYKDATFDAIIEAMQIYRDISAEIQTRACGVLWSLSMDPVDRMHVAQGGGCEAILNAMLVHAREDALQVMALGALKVLSFDPTSKITLVSRGALGIVGDIMRQHTTNPTLHSEGCVILGNLAVDEATQSVAPVSPGEVDAVIQGMMAHPDSLEVNEAACFTLMSLASSITNRELIRKNDMSKVALELAFQKHPDDVGISILTLLRQLKFDSPHLRGAGPSRKLPIGA